MTKETYKMSSSQDPPDPGEKRAAPLVEGAARSINPESREMGSCFQDTDPALLSQSPRLASLDEAAEILEEYLPEYHHYESSDWSDGSNWRLTRASEKQISCLRNFGIDARGGNCGHASRLISKLLRRKQKGLASFSDIRWLTQHGVENARKLTSHEAWQLIELINYELMESGPAEYLGGAE